MNIRSANKSHTPELEQEAYNQKPKDSTYTELKLYAYTDFNTLYQWYGRKRDSVFWDPCGEPFIME